MSFLFIAFIEDSPSDGSAFVAVKGKARLANADSVEPLPSDDNSQASSHRQAKKPETVVPPPSTVSGPILKPLSKADQIRLLRPNCKHADDLEKCGGSGRRHCRDCEVEAA